MSLRRLKCVVDGKKCGINCPLGTPVGRQNIARHIVEPELPPRNEIPPIRADQVSETTESDIFDRKYDGRLRQHCGRHGRERV